jgi:hypothetical protein
MSEAGAGTVDLRRRRKRIAHRATYDRNQLEFVRQWLCYEITTADVSRHLGLKIERSSSAYCYVALTLREAVLRKHVNFNKPTGKK